MRISDWSSDVCSSDLQRRYIVGQEGTPAQPAAEHPADDARIAVIAAVLSRQLHDVRSCEDIGDRRDTRLCARQARRFAQSRDGAASGDRAGARSEEHTSELQSLMRISYAVFCLKKKNKKTHIIYVLLIQKAKT